MISSCLGRLISKDVHACCQEDVVEKHQDDDYNWCGSACHHRVDHFVCNRCDSHINTSRFIAKNYAFQSFVFFQAHTLIKLFPINWISNYVTTWIYVQKNCYFCDNDISHYILFKSGTNVSGLQYAFFVFQGIIIMLQD